MAWIGMVVVMFGGSVIVGEFPDDVPGSVTIGELLIFAGGLIQGYAIARHRLEGKA